MELFGRSSTSPSEGAVLQDTRTDARKDQWKYHGLPERIDGKSFVDVGCWEGFMCAEAIKRGASAVLGIDYCTSPELTKTMAAAPFNFLQLDLLSEKALQLPEFDIVHCAGVLYHVENPLSFLFRLRKLGHAGSSLHLETSYAVGATDDQPVMLFHPGNSLDDNPSNWWSPNEACLREMMALIGLTDLTVTFRRDPKRSSDRFKTGRIGLHGVIANNPSQISEKILPRRPSFMPIGPASGNRR